MAVTALRPMPKFQAFDLNGDPLAGGKLYTYSAGTTTALATYTDSTGTVANANPVILDSRGEASVWFQPLNYKLVLKDSNDNTIWTQDNYSGSPYPITDEWITYVHTWTFIDATHVSTTGDQTAKYQVNDAIRAVTTAGTYYGTITASVYGSVTTLTVDFESGSFDSGVAGSSTISVGVQSTESPALTYATAAAASSAAAALSATSAADSAASALASAGSINLPSIVGNAANMLRAKADESGYEFRTPSEVRSDIGAAGNAFSTVAVSGQSNVVADTTSDTLTLAAGSGVTITTDAATDTVTIAASAGNHELIVHTGNGHGSFNSKIRRFTTTLTNVGTAITYADSAPNGASFTINESGLYNIYYSDSHSTSCRFGISLNSTENTITIQNIAVATRIALTGSSTANMATSTSRTVKLTAGDVVRAHTDGAIANSNDQTVFAIRKVGTV